MHLRIENLPKTYLIGHSLEMTLADNKTAALWASFMPRKKEISNIKRPELYSMQVYDASLSFDEFTPVTTFTKWAAVEVSDISHIPEGLSSYILNGGLYAVFLHKGSFQDFQKTFNYIFQEWMPESGYEVDQREHFELLGEKYKNNHPESEEEVWVPIRKK